MTILNKRLIFFIGVVLVAYSTLVATEPMMNYSISPKRVLVGERVTLEIRLKNQDSQKYQSKIEDSLLIKNQDFVQLHSESKEEGEELLWKYDLTSYRIGSYSIPPVQIRSGANTFSTERTEVEFISSRSEADQELRADYPPMWLPLPWKIIVYILLAILFSFTIGKYLYKKMRSLNWRRFLPRSRHTIPFPAIDSMAWLKRELKRIRDAVETESQLDPLIDDFTLTLRRYLKLKFNEPFTARTTKECEFHLRKHDNFSSLLFSFQKLDTVKFASPQKGFSKSLFLNELNTVENSLCGT